MSLHDTPTLGGLLRIFATPK